MTDATRRWLHDLAFSSWIGGTIVMSVVLCGGLSWWVGRQNQNWLAIIAWLLPLFGTAILMLLLGLILMFTIKWPGRAKGRRPRLILVGLGVLCCLAAWLLPVTTQGAYAHGVGQWIRSNLDTAAIRTWAKTLPIADTPTTVPESNWPRFLSETRPETVDLLPQGVLIAYGPCGPMNSQRQVLIGMATDAKPPSIFKWDDTWGEISSGTAQWKYLSDGVYLYVFWGP